MDTAEAIYRLRTKFGLRQRAFAKLLGVTVTSISRFENGWEPSTAVLAKLIGLCVAWRSSDQADSELESLRTLFAAKRELNIVATVKNLPSVGTNRGVPVADLKFLRSGLNVITSGLNVLQQHAGSSEPNAPEIKQEILENLLEVAGQLKEVLAPYLTYATENDDATTLATEAQKSALQSPPRKPRAKKSA